MFVDFGVIIALILANGFFAAAEMALVSARPMRLQARAESGDNRAQRILRIQNNPGKFLATVQVGITLVGTLASAVGGVEAVKYISPLIEQIPLVARYAQQIALGIVVLIISYLSLVIGELVPKRLALRSPERLAMAFAYPLELLARVAALPIWLLTNSADFVLRLFGANRSELELTSLDEIEAMVRRSTAEGGLLPVQERMIGRIFDYADRLARSEMTPRPDIVAFEVNTSVARALEIAKKHGFSRFPVYQDNLDQMLGYVHVKDLIWAGAEQRLERLARKLTFIPQGTSLPDAFSTLTRDGHHMGVVLDEYGGTDGLITLEDLLEVIVGEIEDEHSPLAEPPERQDEHTWLIAGLTPIHDVGELLGLEFHPAGGYSTLGGFLMAELGKIPQPGDQVRWSGYLFRVESMDRLRVNLVQAQRLKEPERPD